MSIHCYLFILSIILNDLYHIYSYIHPTHYLLYSSLPSLISYHWNSHFSNNLIAIGPCFHHHRCHFYQLVLYCMPVCAWVCARVLMPIMLFYNDDSSSFNLSLFSFLFPTPFIWLFNITKQSVKLSTLCSYLYIQYIYIFIYIYIRKNDIQ